MYCSGNPITGERIIEGNITKPKLLIESGARIDPIEEEYQSTSLGMAARWGHTDMVTYLLSQGADANKSGAAWSTPLSWAKQKGYKKLKIFLLKQVQDNLKEKKAN